MSVADIDPHCPAKLCPTHFEERVPGSMATVIFLDSSDGRLRFEAGPGLTDSICHAMTTLAPGKDCGPTQPSRYSMPFTPPSKRSWVWEWRSADRSQSRVRGVRFLSKPSDPEELLAALSATVDR